MFDVVIDTNVLVSALIKAETAPRQVIRLCLAGEIRPLMSNALFLEHEDVTARVDLYSRSPLDADERTALIDAYLSVCRWVPIYFLWRPNLSDEADNHLLELAVAGNAQWLITGNIGDFSGSELLFPELDIVTAREFLDRRT